jgi:PAS domain S-box-containing protein
MTIAKSPACCFCGQPVATTVTDPVTLRAPETSAGAPLFCHGACLQQSAPSARETPLIDPAVLLGAIVDSSEDAIISKTLDGTITSWNRGAERLFGYTADEAIGKSITLLIPSERLDEETEILARIARGERIEHFETIRRAKDGRLIDISLSISPVRGPDGMVVGASKIARDISTGRDGERARQAEALLAAIVASSDDAIISKSLKGVISSWNAGAERLFGFTAEEALGQHISLIIPADRLDEETVILGKVQRGERIDHYETVRKAKNGRLIDISLTISPLRDEKGKIVGASKVARDISGQKEVNRQLQEADQRKDEFLALLAHELRNPLGPIRHAVKILAAKTPGPAELQWATNIIDRQTDHMSRLVDDLLDVSRITRGTIELRQERVDIAEIVKAALEAGRTAIEKARHDLRVSLPREAIYIDGDRTRLIQIIANLVDNAAKYTDPAGRIVVSADREGDAVVIRVRDNGIGIPPELLPKIFDMFTQGGVAQRGQGGLGVGLSLVERLVKLHGGTITATSAGEGTGSEFTVRLPVAGRPARPAPRESAKKDPQAASGPRCRVLVVDDNVDSADSLAMLLEILGHDVQTANDGHQAIATAGEFQPDIAILDIGLPQMSGYQLAQRLRQQPWAKQVVLVALTGWGQEEHRRRSADAGFDYHLTKPVDFEMLQRIIAETARALPERRLVAR